MKFSDAIVGCLYRAKRSPNYYDVKLDCDNTVAQLSKGTILECISIDNKAWGRFTKYKIVEMPVLNQFSCTKLKVGSIVKVTTHTCLELIDDTYNGLSPRQRKVASLQAEINNDEKRAAALVEEATKLASVIKEKTLRVNSLNEFDSDEAELAHTLAEMFKSGGDEEKILELLLKRGATNKL